MSDLVEFILAQHGGAQRWGGCLDHRRGGARLRSVLAQQGPSRPAGFETVSADVKNGWKMIDKTTPTFLGSGDPARQRTDYYPPWLDNLADDVTMEGSVLNGIVRGAEDVRTVLAYARTLYEYQDFIYIGEYGENGFVEDYASKVRGEPIANIAVVYRNPVGQTQHLVVNHRPLPSVLLFSRLLGEHFAGTRYARYFAAPSADAERG